MSYNTQEKLSKEYGTVDKDVPPLIKCQNSQAPMQISNTEWQHKITHEKECLNE